MKEKVSLVHFKAKEKKHLKKIPHLTLWTIQTSKENGKKTTKIAENNQDEKFYNHIIRAFTPAQLSSRNIIGKLLQQISNWCWIQSPFRKEFSLELSVMKSHTFWLTMNYFESTSLLFWRRNPDKYPWHLLKQIPILEVILKYSTS